MRLLLDTHALLWWLSDDSRLGQPARDLIADPANDVLVSVVSLWDIQVKVRVGKLTADLPAILREIEAQAFDLLPMTPAHFGLLGTLATHHQDPFDHLLIAQALVEAAAFVSEDGRVQAHGVRVVRCSRAG